MSEEPLKLVSWNIAHRQSCWRFLLEHRYDVALLQEAGAPPEDVRARLRFSAAPWSLGGATYSRSWRSAVVALSDRVQVRHLATAPIDQADDDTLAVSRAGSLDVAEVTIETTGEKLLVASMYAAWEVPVRVDDKRRWIISDASAHRLISDLCGVLYNQEGHRVLVAGDLNLMRGYGESGSPYWGARYDTVFARMEAIGIPFVGPELAEGAALIAPPPAERPAESKTVPTYRTRIADPMSATRQLDFVFASRSIASRVRTRAVDAPDVWGPRDHCRIEIELEVT